MTVIEMTSVGALVVSVLALLWTVLWSLRVSNQMKALKRAETIGDHEKRLTKLEGVVHGLPHKVASHDDVERVHQRVSDVRKVLGKVSDDTSATKATVDGLKHTVGLLLKHELKEEG